MIEIAVCEDEQPIREYIKRLTEQSSDVHVSTFERGEDLLKEKTVFDIILLVQLKYYRSKMNNFSLVRQLDYTPNFIVPR